MNEHSAFECEWNAHIQLILKRIACQRHTFSDENQIVLMPIPHTVHRTPSLLNVLALFNVCSFSCWLLTFSGSVITQRGKKITYKHPNPKRAWYVYNWVWRVPSRKKIQHKTRLYNCAKKTRETLSFYFRVTKCVQVRFGWYLVTREKQKDLTLQAVNFEQSSIVNLQS